MSWNNKEETETTCSSTLQQWRLTTYFNWIFFVKFYKSILVTAILVTAILVTAILVTAISFRTAWKKFRPILYIFRQVWIKFGTGCPQNECEFCANGAVTASLRLGAHTTVDWQFAHLLSDLGGIRLGRYRHCRSQRPRVLRGRSAAANLLRSWVRKPPGAWIFVCCECRVLSDRGLCDELITRPEESYGLW